MKAFVGNGYPLSFIRSASAARPPRKDDRDREEEKLCTVQLPYIAGISEWIRRVCKDFNIRAVFKSSVLSSLGSKTYFLKRNSSMKCHSSVERCTSVRLHIDLKHI